MAKGTNHPSVAISKNKNSRSLATDVFPAGDNKLNMGMLFRFVKYEVNYGQGTKAIQTRNITGGHVALPLPDGLSDKLDVNYDITDLGSAAFAANAGKDTVNAFKNEGAISALGTLGSAAAGATEYLARSALNAVGSTGAIASLETGNVPNPFTTAVFKNVTLKTHTLNWTLTPETPEDSMAIKKIVNLFRMHALPGVTPGKPFLTMPNEVQVVFFGTNALYGFGRCVITNVTVNYNPRSGPAFYKNVGQGLISAPQQVELQVQLNEVEALTKASFDPTVGGDGSTAVSQSLGSTTTSPQQAERPGNKLVNQNEKQDTQHQAAVAAATTESEVQDETDKFLAGADTTTNINNPAKTFAAGSASESSGEGSEQVTPATTAQSSNTAVRQTSFKGTINGPFQAVYATEIQAEQKRLGDDPSLPANKRPSPAKRRIIEAQAKQNIGAKLINGTLAPRGNVTVSNVEPGG